MTCPVPTLTVLNHSSTWVGIIASDSRLYAIAPGADETLPFLPSTSNGAYHDVQACITLLGGSGDIALQNGRNPFCLRAGGVVEGAAFGIKQAVRTDVLVAELSATGCATQLLLQDSGHINALSAWLWTLGVLGVIAVVLLAVVLYFTAARWRPVRSAVASGPGVAGPETSDYTQFASILEHARPGQ